MTTDLYGRYAEALRLGHQQASEGKFKEALHSYETAAGLAGARALPHIAVGGMHLRLGHKKEALAAYERALALEGNNLDALTGRAAALLAAGRRAEAEAARQQIAAIRGGGLRPTGAGQALPLIGAEAHAVAGEQARAAGHSEAAIDAWLAESDEHARAEHFDAALDACLRSLALDSGSTRVHLELVRIYFMRGWHELAVARALLLDRLLSLEADPRIEGGLRHLVAEFASTDGRVVAIAERGQPSPVQP